MKKLKETLKRIATAGLAAVMLTSQAEELVTESVEENLGEEGERAVESVEENLEEMDEVTINDVVYEIAVTDTSTSTLNVGGTNADGIGAGENNYHATIQIGTVTICDGIDKVDASRIKDFGSVVYMHGESNVTANKTDYFRFTEDGDHKIILPPHTHSFTYSASGATITAMCSDDCPLTDHKATLTIAVPTGDLTYDSSAKLATITGDTETLGTPEINYQKKNGNAWGLQRPQLPQVREHTRRVSRWEREPVRKRQVWNIL